MRLSRQLLLGILLAICIALPATTLAEGLTTADRLHALATEAHEGVEAAERNDTAKMQAVYSEIHEAWESFEDDVRAADAMGYVKLEDALDKVKDGLAAKPINVAATGQAFASLQQEATELAVKLAGGATAAPATASSPAAVVRELDEALAALGRGDTAAAAEPLTQAVRFWPSIEGAIAAKSQSDYSAIESDLGRAMAALEATPADSAAAKAAIERLRQRIAPYAESQTYTAFDAAAILLREGLEALLVVVALLAFLRRSGNSDKRGWIWVGGALGIVASLAVAFVLQAIFSQVSAGQNREVIEGVTGLFAAAMLFYVSYWLHSKSSLHAWKRYIDQQTTRALARGSMAGLALLSFLAVFREGAETVVFYLGMAPAISSRDLLLGMGMGAAVLVVAAVLMLVIGVRLPLRLFFQVAALLVYYLGFKFVGTGLHALQVADIVPTTPIGWMPSVPFLGIFPTWETLVPQLALLAGALGAFLYLRWQDRRMRVTTSAVGAS